MKKGLSYVCDYLKALVIPHTPDDFIVAEPFRHGLTDDELRKGIDAFREFMYDLYDKLAENESRLDIEEGSKYDPQGCLNDNGSGHYRNRFPSIKPVRITKLQTSHQNEESRERNAMTI